MGKKLKKRFEKKPGGLWLAWLLILVVCLLLCVLALYRAATTSQDPSGWYQVAIGSIVLPPGLYALFEVSKKIIESQQEPKIEVGVVFDGRLRSEVRKLKELPSDLVVDPGLETPRFALVIRNGGTASAKSVEIELELKHTTPTDGNQFILREPPDFVCESDYRAYVCSGIDGRELIVRAGEEKMFAFSVHPLGAHIPYQLSSPLSIALQCTVRAEGLNRPPLENTLTVSFERANESD